jgi:IS30 family transposase
MGTHYSQVTEADRISIQSLVQAKLSGREIGRQQGLSPSSISPEFSRRELKQQRPLAASRLAWQMFALVPSELKHGLAAANLARMLFTFLAHRPQRTAVQLVARANRRQTTCGEQVDQCRRSERAHPGHDGLTRNHLLCHLCHAQRRPES